MTRRRITVQVDAAGRLEYALHLNQAHRHHNQITHHAFAGGISRSLDDTVGGGIAVGQFAVFVYVNIGERPSIFESRARCDRTDGGGVVLIGVEGRVEINEVDAFRVDAAHDVEIVAHPDCAIGEIWLCHFPFPARMANDKNVNAVGVTVQGVSAQRRIGYGAVDLLGRVDNYRRSPSIWQMKAGIHRTAADKSLKATVSSVVCAFATMTPLNPRQRVQVLSSMSSPRET